MGFKNWLQDIFLSTPQLVTGVRFMRWKRLLITLGILALLLLIGAIVFGNPKVKPDEKNYQQVSADEISKKGVVILSSGNYEIRKKGQSESKTFSGSGAASGGLEQSQVISRKDRAHSEYVIPAGSKIPVVLDGDLNSELGQSPVVAQTREVFSFQGKVLIPSGSKILGMAGQSQDSDRIAIQFDQIVLPNGHQIPAGGLAMMNEGSPGVVGELHTRRASKIVGALGSSFISGAASAFQTTSPNIFGLQQPEGSTRNAILNGVAQATLDQGKRFSDEAQQEKGYVTLGSGTTFLVYFEKEIDLSGVLE